MNISQFISEIYFNKDVPKPIEVLEPSESTINVVGKEIPLYGELLLLEKEIFNQITTHREVFIKCLEVASNKVSERFNQGSLTQDELIARLVDAMVSHGMYDIRTDSQIQIFDSSLVNGYETLVSYFANPEKNIDPETFLDANNPTDYSLRELCFEHYLSWIDLGVQGGTMGELVSNILNGEIFIKPGTDEKIDITEVLIELDPKIYTMLDAFTFANTPTSMAEVLLYTRGGFIAPILPYLRASTAKRIVETLYAEHEPVPVIADNTAVPAIEGEGDQRQTTEPDQTTGKSARRQKATTV